VRKSVLLLSILALSCATEDEPPPGDAPPSFNYIPLDENVCGRTDPGYDATKARTALDDLAALSTYTIEEMEVCGDDQVSACGGCTAADNTILEVMRSTGTWADQWDQKVTGDTTMEQYFQAALRYPFRWATASVDETLNLVTLGVASGETCTATTAPAPMTCATYALQPETLASDCQASTLTWIGAVSQSGNRLSVTSSPLGAGTAFGFKVPLLGAGVPAQYDADGDKLPDPDRFPSAEALQMFMDAVPSLAIRMEYSSISFDIDETTKKGCGKLTGFIRRDALSEYTSDLDKLNGYLHTDPTNAVPTGYIKAVLTIGLSGTSSVATATDL